MEGGLRGIRTCMEGGERHQGLNRGGVERHQLFFRIEGASSRCVRDVWRAAGGVRTSKGICQKMSVSAKRWLCPCCVLGECPSYVQRPLLILLLILILILILIRILIHILIVSLLCPG